MPSVEKSVLVPFSGPKMYALVADIKSYPKFLPWCGGSHIVSYHGDTVTARIDIDYKGVTQSFTTKNVNQPEESIAISLVDGPFSELHGVWKFKPLKDDACKVELDLRYAFSNLVLEALIGPIFHYIAGNFIESFRDRAEKLYGHPPTIEVEVVLALAEATIRQRLRVPEGTTIGQAVRSAELDEPLARAVKNHPLGLFGRLAPQDTLLQAGDRIEIYRPLAADPKDARRRRARKRPLNTTKSGNTV